MRLRLLAAACALALGTTAALAASTQGHPQSQPAVNGATAGEAITGVGVVRKVDVAQGKVTLQHEPIERLGWPAMTMAFKVGDPKLIQRLAPGKQVRFAFVQEGGAYVITDVRERQ